MGRGIIDPVDDIRSSNPASNADLLKALTVAISSPIIWTPNTSCGLVAQSRPFLHQRAFKTNKWNEDDGENYLRISIRDD